MNEATCKQTLNSYQCICAPGWTGKLCDVEMVSCKDAAIRKGKMEYISMEMSLVFLSNVEFEELLSRNELSFCSYNQNLLEEL